MKTLPAWITGDEKPRPGIGVFHITLRSLDGFRGDDNAGAAPCRSSPWNPSQSWAVEQTANETEIRATILRLILFPSSSLVASCCGGPLLRLDENLKDRTMRIFRKGTRTHRAWRLLSVSRPEFIHGLVFHQLIVEYLG